jgi:hypothetical protein
VECTEECDDSNPCTHDACAPGAPGADPLTGCVSYVAEDGTSCDDFLYCVIGETCLAGACDPDSGAPLCDDGVTCTEDPCDEELDSCLAPVPSNDLCPPPGPEICQPNAPDADENGCVE